MEAKETRHGVAFSSLDTELAAGTGVTKRALVDYLDGVAERFVPALRDRPLSVIRSTRGQRPFMQKNLPDHAPEWIERSPMWAESSQRTVDYAVCNDVRTLMWFANQRAVEYHVTLVCLSDLDAPTHLVIDLDPPEGAGFAAAARTERLDPASLTTAFLKDDRDGKVFLDATRGGLGTVVSVYSPRLRPGVPVSWPLAWDELDGFDPRDVTIENALALLGDGDADPWRDRLPAPQPLPAELVEEGRGIPVPRVAAMHEGKRRRRAAAD